MRRRQNPLELVFEDISTFDAEKPIVGSLLRKLGISKKHVASDLVKKAPRPPGVDISLRNRLDKLRDRQEPVADNNDLSPPLSPPPPVFQLAPLPPPPPPPPFPGIPPPPHFIPPPSARFLEPFQQQPNNFGNFHVPD